MTRAGIALVALALAACSHPAAPSTPKASSTDAVVNIKSNLADAEVVIDGGVVGPVSRMPAGVALEPGLHQVELRHDDYFSAYVQLQLARGEHKSVTLDLQPILP